MNPSNSKPTTTCSDLIIQVNTLDSVQPLYHLLSFPLLRLVIKRLEAASNAADSLYALPLIALLRHKTKPDDSRSRAEKRSRRQPYEQTTLTITHSTNDRENSTDIETKNIKLRPVNGCCLRKMAARKELQSSNSYWRSLPNIAAMCLYLYVEILYPDPAYRLPSLSILDRILCFQMLPLSGDQLWKGGREGVRSTTALRV